MSEHDDLFGETPDNDENENDEEVRETDPSIVAFMDQQTAEFNQLEHEFADRYGFVHKCRCDQDYTEGRMVEVTECYAGMTIEALEACATLVAENTLLRTMIRDALGKAISEAETETPEDGGNDVGEEAD